MALTAKEKGLIEELDLSQGAGIVTNPFSKQKVYCDATAVALYDYIKGCELLNLTTLLRRGLSAFRKLYPDEYYVLLD